MTAVRTHHKYRLRYIEPPPPLASSSAANTTTFFFFFFFSCAWSVRYALTSDILSSAPSSTACLPPARSLVCRP